MKAITEDGIWRISTTPETERLFRMDGTIEVFRNVSEPIKVFVFLIFTPL